MLSDLIHKRTFQMYDASAGDTFQMEMFLTVMSHLHVLIHRLAPLLCHIFHDSSLFGKFIQVTVNRCDVHLVIVFFKYWSMSVTVTVRSLFAMRYSKIFFLLVVA